MIYDRKMMIGYYWLSKFSLKEFFFLSAAKRIFNLVASGENIFEPTSKTQKTWLRIVQKYTTENTNATPCTYSGKLQFANTHCGNVFIIGSRKFSQIFGEKKTDFRGFLELYTSLILIFKLSQFTGRIELWKWQGKEKAIKCHQNITTESYLGEVSFCWFKFSHSKTLGCLI